MSKRERKLINVDVDQLQTIETFTDLKRVAGLAAKVRLLLDEAIASRSSPAVQGIQPSQVPFLFPEWQREDIKTLAIACLEYLAQGDGEGERAIKFIKAQLGVEKISGCDLAILAASLNAKGQNLQALLNKENVKNGNA